MRARFVGAVLAICTLGMALTATGSVLVQRDRVDARIDSDIAIEVREFRNLAASGRDPSTGRPFTDVRDLMLASLRMSLPREHESVATFIDRQPAYVPQGTPDIDITATPGLVRRIVATRPGTAVHLSTYATRAGALRYAVVPVSVAGDRTQGLYVVGFARDAEQNELSDVTRSYVLLSLLCLVLVGAVAWLVAGRLLRPLRLLSRTAQKISATDLSQRIEVTGRDDLSQMARTFNAMLDRLEQAFAGQRRLLDDVGHELRTPITIVSGHLELVDTNDPSDVQATRELVTDELDRMRRLVDDLVLLARADRPGFVAPHPTDLSALVEDVLTKASALGDRRWAQDATTDAVVTVDQQRITQALLELATNAVRHTGPGDVVAAGARVEASGLRIWVRDTGHGIPAEDQARIFQRFGRVGAGRGHEGSGLGLAIVSAIAHAHGGWVAVDSAPGRGSTFTLELPVHRTRPAPVARHHTAEEAHA